MNLELYEIICEELRQRKVNNRVSEILIGLCKEQLEAESCVTKVKVVKKEIRKSHQESEVEEFLVEDLSEDLELVEGVEEFDGGSEELQSVSRASNPKVGVSEGLEEVVVSDENLDMINKMFG